MAQAGRPRDAARDRRDTAPRALPVKPVATNRKAFHEYFVEDELEAGVALTGTEVKSLREGRASLTDGYVTFEDGEAWLRGVHVPPYLPGSYNNVDPVRPRKLLLHRRELGRLALEIQRKGSTCVPLSLYFKGSRVKVRIALVTGKKLHDKRETIRRRERDREARAAIKGGRSR